VVLGLDCYHRYKVFDRSATMADVARLEKYKLIEEFYN
jgi:hypothetical protein